MFHGILTSLLTLHSQLGETYALLTHSLLTDVTHNSGALLDLETDSIASSPAPVLTKEYRFDFSGSWLLGCQTRHRLNMVAVFIAALPVPGLLKDGRISSSQAIPLMKMFFLFCHISSLPFVWPPPTLSSTSFSHWPNHRAGYCCVAIA